MEYESDILKRLIKTYGVVGNPRYISEIIKEFIVRGKERFPELFTYQSDWLAHIDVFGLNPTYMVSYTGQSIYTPNSLERPVKSAILRGETVKISELSIQKQGNSSGGTLWLHSDVIDIFKPNTLYTFFYEIEISNLESVNGEITVTNDTRSVFPIDLKLGTQKEGTQVICFEQLSKTSFEGADRYGLRFADFNGNVIVKKALYCEGSYSTTLTNWESGLKSVKMPDLTTTGKNLFDINAYISLKNNATIEGEWLILWEDYQTRGSTWGVTLAPNTTYYVSDFIDSDITTNSSMCRFRVVDKMGNEILKLGGFNRLLTTTNECDYIFEISRGSSFIGSITKFKIQIEQGTQATSFEPYKTNILTVNEPIELRGIGDVKDELNVLTGELTQRIGEVVLDGSEDWRISELTRPNHLRLYLFATRFKQNQNVINNRFADNGNIKGKDIEGVYITNTIDIQVEHSRLSEVSVDGFKEWLSNNNIKVQAMLSKESIKTVDLSILDQNGQNVKQLMSFNGGTHFNTGSLEGSLLPSVSVTVETDLEETLKVCSLEGNTL